MKLVLHIGSEKTGTTSFQNWASGNRELLRQQGVVYSRSLGDSNHTQLYLWAIPPGQFDDGFRRINVFSELERAEFHAALPRRLASEVQEAKDANCHSFVLSSELCHSRLITVDLVQRLYGLLSPLFNSIEIFCSLRSQVDVFVSFTSTWARGRLRVSRQLLDRVTPNNPYYDYYGLINRWSNVFGPDAVSLVPFKRFPDFSAFFAKRLSLNTSGFVPPARMNEAIDVGLMALINALPDRLPEKGISPMEDLYINEFPCNERLQLGSALAAAVQSRFTESNEKLVKLRNDITTDDLVPDWSKYTEPSNLDKLEKPCPFSIQLNHLIEIYNAKIALSEAAHALTRCEHFSSLGNKAGTKIAFNDAKNRIAQLGSGGLLQAEREAIEQRVDVVARRVFPDAGTAGRSHRSVESGS